MRKSSSASIPDGHLALDSSVLIEMIYASAAGSELSKKILERKVFGHVSNLNLSEAEYVLCRQVGEKTARERVGALAGSGLIEIEEESQLHILAARVKCERAISIADCYTLAVAQLVRCPALFATREKDLVRELERKPFPNTVHFLAS